MSKIVIVAEALGKGRTLEAGNIFRPMLRQVGIDERDTPILYVFNRQINGINSVLGTKAEGIPGMPAAQRGRYVRREFARDIEMLFNQIRSINPNIIIALGATPSWALLHQSGIKAIRGAVAESHLGIKVLPTYEPVSVRKDWSLRPIVLADLMKAKRESAFPEIRRPRREIWVEPTLDDIERFFYEHIEPSPDLAIDIETKGTTITCVGFAPTPSVALVIPFYDPSQSDGNYWRSLEDELSAWEWVRIFCSLRKRIVFQNGMYDMSFLWRAMGIPTPYASDDTMLLHHALQPEMEKGLGFMATLHTDEASWKFMRKTDTIKRED